MPNWLSAAKRAFQNQPPKEPERFEIRCGCETLVTGLRTREPQQVTCPSCMHVLLVFPESLYPLPKPLKPKPVKTAEKGKGARPGASQALASPAATAAERKPSGRPEAEGATAATVAEPAAPTESALRRSLLQSSERITQVRKAVLNRRHFTPLRMVVLVMCLVLGLTGYWMVRRRAREQATQTLTEALKAGRKALDEDDLLSAGSEFRRAAAALDVLRQTDATARSTRQTARELTAINGLADKSLRDLLAEGAETARAGNAESWKDIFRSSYHGNWLVLDTVVTPLPVENPREPTEFLIDLPVSSGENQLLLHLKSSEFEGVERDGRPRRMVLAVQLRDCIRDAERPNVWRLMLDEKTPFLWTDANLLQRIGWPREAALEQLIREQAQWAGVER